MPLLGIGFRSTGSSLDLIQLAFPSGWCVLVQVGLLEAFPDGLCQILADEDVVKCGRSGFLSRLRHLSELMGRPPEGIFHVKLACREQPLNEVAKEYLKLDLAAIDAVKAKVSWRERDLPKEQRDHAANQALVSINLLLALAVKKATEERTRIGAVRQLCQAAKELALKSGLGAGPNSAEGKKVGPVDEVPDTDMVSLVDLLRSQSAVGRSPKKSNEVTVIETKEQWLEQLDRVSRR